MKSCYLKKIWLPLVLLFLLLGSRPASSEWMANTGLGITYSDNYALQNGDYTNIDQEMVNRTGTELSGGVSWQSFDKDGGFTADATALVDKATDSSSKITSFSLAGSRIQPLSRDWASRFTARLLQYGNDDFTANSYDGFSLEATFGWFGERGRGLDMRLSWINEDHNQNVDALYKTQRLGANAVYYFAGPPGGVRNSIGFGVQQHDADDDRRDGTSLLASADMDQIRWGNSLLRLSLSWRQDRYDLAYTPLPGDGMTGMTTPGGSTSGTGSFSSSMRSAGTGPGGGPGTGPGDPGTGPGIPSTTEPRIDTQIYASASYQYPFSRSLRLFVNANTGRYSSVNGKQSFYNLFSGVRLYFN